MSTYIARKNAAIRNGVSHAKLLSTTALTAAGMIALSPTTALAVDQFADWDGVNIVAGNADVNDTGLGSTNIEQHSMRAVGEAQELHIGEMGHVNINQNGSGALFVARVIGNHSDPTQILGKLTADGRVMVLDRNGVLFGANSQVDVAGISVSTGDVSNADIMDGDNSFTFENFGAGKIQLEGTINVAEAGLAAFVSPTVVNNGVINAKLGTVALAAGEKVTLDLYGDGLVEIALEGELADALLENKGTIAAEGGNVIMTAQAAKEAVDNIINVEGVVTVASATQVGGKIVLSGGSKGTVKTSGVIDATGATGGGEISVTGENINATDDALVIADAIDDGNGGTVKLVADRNMLFSGAAYARGGAVSGNGGFIEVSGYEGLGYEGSANTSAANGEAGQFLLDPDHAIIHSGWLDPLWVQLVIRAENLADDMHRNGSVIVQANSLIDVGTDINFIGIGNGDIDLRNYNYDVLNTHGSPFFWNWTIDNISGTNNPGNLVLKSSVVNVNKNLFMGAGNVTLDAATLNLKGRVYGQDGTTALGDNRLIGTAALATVNVLSPSALINQAINFADDATNLTTINIEPGTYNESVLANEANIKIQGTAGTVIAPNSPGIKIVANNVTVDSVAINGAGGADGYGIWLDNVNNTTITNTTITNSAQDGIFGSGIGGTNLIKGVTITGTGDNGIQITGNDAGSLTTLDGNTISNIGWDGIQINNGAGNVTATGNTINNVTGASGIAVMFQGGVTQLVNNIINGVDRLGIYIWNSNGVQITGNDINDTGREGGNNWFLSGIHLEGANNTLVQGNLVRNTGGDAIHVGGAGNAAAVDTSGNQIKNNVLGYTTLAAATSAGDDNIKGDGIEIVDSNGAVVTGNKIVDATGNGIYNNSSDNTTIGGAGVLGNTITSVDLSGVLVNPSFNVDVIGNVITTANEGVKLTGNTDILVQGNIISDIETDGVQVVSNNGKLEILGNSINADDHGVYYGDSVTAGDDLDIHDNTIVANEDNAIIGSGVFFNGTVTGGTINIGDGSGVALGTDPSNKITVLTNSALPAGDINNLDGIHFNKDVGTNAKIIIDGNRIGYNNALTQQAIIDDGIEFRGQVNGNADIDIVDNYIASLNDGVVFNGNISGNTNILIGGSGDANFIDADSGGLIGHGIVFNGSLSGGSLINISYNTIDADQDGVLFNGATSNASSGDEILISDNDIWGRNNGIRFAGAVSGANHDIRIADNTIEGENENGIVFGSTINDAEIRIHSNTRITGGLDGIFFNGQIQNNALVEVTSNNEITGEGDDGIDFNADINGSSVVKVNNNSAINGNDNGVEFDDVNGSASIEVSGNNAGIFANNHGIYFDTLNGATLNIHDNIITANQDNGVVGSGIFFNGTVNNATVNIGNGNNPSDPSNFITVGPVGSADTDGIHFHDTVGNGANINIDGNRIGYTGTPGNQATSVVSSLFGDGIEFRGAVNGTANVDIGDNRIRSNGDGVKFASTVSGTADILVGGSNDGNTIDANGNGVSFLGSVTSNALVEISQNEIDGNLDGILFNGAVNNTRGGSEQEVYIFNNDIWGQNNGIHFNGVVSNGSHDTLISDNEIEGENGQGIVFDETVDDAHIRIVENDSILGQVDGVRFLGDIQNGATINIDNNTTIRGIDEEAVHFFEEIEDSTVTVFSNDNLEGGDHGVELAGDIDDSTIVISANNHGIHANNHGIVFGGNVFNGSDIDIHDNIISANEDGGTTGDGIHFAGDIYTATINIGDGNGPGLGDNPSNYIKGWDGIHFDGEVNNGARIVIDGNRLGYYKTSGGSVQNAELSDDGIQFIGDVDGDAKITITENRIQSDDDGISFIGEIQDAAEITIGGASGLGNVIFADGDGTQFEDDIEDNALIKITHNDIEADNDGVVFNGDTSNARNFHDEEILIAYNDIVGGINGVNFEGEASDFRHDIVIRNNERIVGQTEDGIVHTGNINDAELWILNNEEIFGDRDGVHVEGFFYNDARIVIDGNEDVSADDGDGIEVTDNGFTNGADVDITNNYAHDTGDNGIEVNNVDGVYIYNNDITGAGNDGINVWNSDFADIDNNDIFARQGFLFFGGSRGAERDGIHVVNSDYVDITNNNITAEAGSFPLGSGREGAGRDGIHVFGGRNVDIIDNNVFDDLSTFLFFPWDYQLGAGRDGIHVVNNYDADVYFNDIRGTGDDGIYAFNVDFGDIRWNDVAVTGDDGIDVRNSYRVDVVGNDTAATLGDGIQVRNSWGADVLWNDVTGAGDDGIDVENSDFSDVNNNNVFLVVNNGIEVQNSDFADINWNTIGFVGDNGIYVNPSDFVTIDGNHIFHAGDDGIQVNSGKFITIKNNFIKHSGDDGIDVNGSQKVFILSNTIFGSDDDGIVVDADKKHGHSFWPNFIKISGNNVDQSGDDGVQVSGTKVNLVLSNNQVTDSYDNGVLLIAKQKHSFFGKGGYEEGPEIYLIAQEGEGEGYGYGYGCDEGDCGDYEGTFNSWISGNTIQNSGSNGLYVKGYGHNDVVLKDNFFIDNPVGARFESGKIDLSDILNPNHFVVTAGYGIPDGYDYVTGMQFELAKSSRPDSLTIVGETLGATFFDGYLAYPVGDAYYIRFEDGAILDCDGNVIVIDGTQASWDGVVPDDFPGNALPPAILQQIEDRLFDADDPALNGRGQIFVGVPADGFSIENFEDFLKEFGPFGGIFRGLNVTVTGLPPINLGAQNFANITPFAGEQNPEDIEPQAGDEQGGTAPQDIEPAAGGSDVACWGDAASLAGAGTAVNYSWGGTFEESIADAASCGSQSL